MQERKAGRLLIQLQPARPYISVIDASVYILQFKSLLIQLIGQASRQVHGVPGDRLSCLDIFEEHGAVEKIERSSVLRILGFPELGHKAVDGVVMAGNL